MHSFQEAFRYWSSDLSVCVRKWWRGGPLLLYFLSSGPSKNSTPLTICLHQMPSPQVRKSAILSRCAWYAFGYFNINLCGMMVFFALGKQLASFSSLDYCSFTVSLCLFSSDVISACIFMIPGVMISPGLLLDVAEDMLDKVLKWRSCCSVFVDLEQMIRCWMGACTIKECKYRPYNFFSVRICGFPMTSSHAMAWRKVWLWSRRMLLGQRSSGLAYRMLDIWVIVSRRVCTLSPTTPATNKKKIGLLIR